MFNFVLYPTKFKNIVVQNAKVYSLEPALVYAVIKAESNFDEKAKSNSNALGLMQLLPTTANWIAEELNVSFNESDLFDPEVNVRFGCFYLKYLYDRFGDTDVVVAAYNAGETKVKDWLGENGKLNVEKIDYPETRNYLKKVKGYYQIYKNNELCA
ncbi:MAG: lytic transglycosylase domain-containing protein [Clostridia bacterium]|nr:lytic transglycosylase domain-containing protein [Clostridia bacterium]